MAREDVHLSFGCEPDFTRRSVGYVGASDGWRDLVDNFRMDWEFRAAERGNIALTAELDASREEWTLGIALGRSAQSSATKLLQSLVDPFERHRDGYVRQWRRAEIGEQYDISAHTGDEGGTYRLSRCVLLAHEDKLFQGAIIASLSIPWGEIKGDDEIGGYHLGLDARSGAKRHCPARDRTERHAVARPDLAGMHSKGRRRFSAE